MLAWLTTALFYGRATPSNITVLCAAFCSFHTIFKGLTVKMSFMFDGQRLTTKPVNYFSKYENHAGDISTDPPPEKG